MFKIVRLFLIFIVVVIGIVLVIYNYQITVPASSDKSVVSFEIKSGDGVNQISEHLFQAGLIKSKFYFEVYAWAKKWEGRFVAGEHQLSASMNIREITKQLVKFGSTESVITVIEGWNNKEIAAYLQSQNLFSQEEFLVEVGKNLSDYVSRYDFLADKPANIDLEGYLFPDTYRVYKNATPREVTIKILDNFNEKLTEDLRSKIKDQGKSIFEIITLASIIEKEVRNPADMKMVADIFYKRLKDGMALQSDATVNYVTGKGLVQPTAEDLKINNPYNTYIYAGLTPGPISNPGLNAIMAAIEPTPNLYYYFLTTPEGEVIYANTYKEHLQNKARYLQ